MKNVNFDGDCSEARREAANERLHQRKYYPPLIDVIYLLKWIIGLQVTKIGLLVLILLYMYSRGG